MAAHTKISRANAQNKYIRDSESVVILETRFTLDDDSIITVSSRGRNYRVAAEQALTTIMSDYDVTLDDALDMWLNETIIDDHTPKTETEGKK
jgi:hypothetical protein